MRRELVRRSDGAQAAYEVAIEKDTQLHEALDLFKQVHTLKDLLALADAWNRDQLAKAAADSAAKQEAMSSAGH